MLLFGLLGFDSLRQTLQAIINRLTDTNQAIKDKLNRDKKVESISNDFSIFDTGQKILELINKKIQVHKIPF